MIDDLARREKIIDDLPTKPAYDSPFRPKRVRFPTKPKTAFKAAPKAAPVAKAPPKAAPKGESSMSRLRRSAMSLSSFCNREMIFNVSLGEELAHSTEYDSEAPRPSERAMRMLERQSAYDRLTAGASVLV